MNLALYGRKWFSYSNEGMNHVDCVIKGDVYPQKFIKLLKISVCLYIYIYSKNIRGISRKNIS